MSHPHGDVLKKYVMRVILFLTFFTALLPAKDPQLEGPGLAITLISENRSVTAGQPFTVGLHIHHHPGFHTYWKNPGMVGMKTSIEWILPEGFTASEIQWPNPENTFMADYPCHGYERDVTLLVIISPPKKISAKEVTLKAKGIWMCCAKGCFPGHETFSMSLPVTKEPIADATAKAHIAKAASEMPSTEHTVKATLLSEIDARSIKIHFQSTNALPAKNLYFFSNDRQISSDKPQKFETQKNGSIILIVPRSEFSPKGATSIEGVLKAGEAHLALKATSAS
jgi:DsbC/DsbD-like thiol-disulfide interchange protein